MFVWFSKYCVINVAECGFCVVGISVESYGRKRTYTRGVEVPTTRGRKRRGVRSGVGDIGSPSQDQGKLPTYNGLVLSCNQLPVT